MTHAIKIIAADATDQTQLRDATAVDIPTKGSIAKNSSAEIHSFRDSSSA
jgi:hypothetical protein